MHARLQENAGRRRGTAEGASFAWGDRAQEKLSEIGRTVRSRKRTLGAPGLWNGLWNGGLQPGSQNARQRTNVRVKVAVERRTCFELRTQKCLRQLSSIRDMPALDSFSKIDELLPTCEL